MIYPYNPDKSGWHWVGGKPHYWLATQQRYHVEGKEASYTNLEEFYKSNGKYQGPIPTILEIKELASVLKWYLENDETYEGDVPLDKLGGQSWNEYNDYWLEGKRRAEAVLDRDSVKGVLSCTP